MAFDKFISKAKKLVDDPKIREKLNSEKAEKLSDQVLDKAAGAADSLTKGKYSEKIANARDAADRAIGTDGHNRGPDGQNPGPDGQNPGPEADRRPGTQAPGTQPPRVDEQTDPQTDPHRRDRPDAG